MAFYLLNFKHRGGEGDRPHQEQVAELLRARLWGIGSNTWNGDLLSPDDRILAYAGREFSFVGWGILSSGVHDWSEEEAAAYPGDHGSGVSLDESVVWDAPVSLRSPVLARSGGIPSLSENANPQFLGAVVPIREEEFDRVVAVGASHSARTKPRAPAISSDEPSPTPAPSDQPAIANAAPTITERLSELAESRRAQPPAPAIAAEAAIAPSAVPSAGPEEPEPAAAEHTATVTAEPAAPAAPAMPEPPPRPEERTHEISAVPEAEVAVTEAEEPEAEAAITTAEPEPPPEPEAPVATEEPEPATPEEAPQTATDVPAPSGKELAVSVTAPAIADRLYELGESLKGLLAAPDGASSLGEDATKAHLITPLLMALGYSDFSDLAFSVSLDAGETVDYVVNVAEEPAIVVETRPLGARLGDAEAARVAERASALGVRWGLLTDGHQIKLFDEQVPNAPDDRLVFEVDLAGYSDREDFEARIYPDVALLTKSEMQDGAKGLIALSDELRRGEQVSEALLDRIASDLEESFRLELVANLRDIFERPQAEGPIGAAERRAAKDALGELLMTPDSSSVAAIRKELSANKLIRLSAGQVVELIADLWENGSPASAGSAQSEASGGEGPSDADG